MLIGMSGSAARISRTTGIARASSSLERDLAVTRTCRLAADVDQVGTLFDHLPRLADRRSRRLPPR